jgi:hypothetical protein
MALHANIYRCSCDLVRVSATLGKVKRAATQLEEESRKATLNALYQESELCRQVGLFLPRLRIDREAIVGDSSHPKSEVRSPKPTCPGRRQSGWS